MRRDVRTSPLEVVLHQAIVTLSRYRRTTGSLIGDDGKEFLPTRIPYLVRGDLALTPSPRSRIGLGQMRRLKSVICKLNEGHVYCLPVTNN